jgi:hypothetical protein
MRIAKMTPEEVEHAACRAMIRSCPPFRLLIAIITLLSLPNAPLPLRAQDFSKPAGYLLAQSEERQVWVNTATGIYHYPGARWYGKTNQGKFMTEKDAIAQGYRAARNGQ